MTAATALTMDRLDAASRQTGVGQAEEKPIDDELEIEIKFRNRKGETLGGTVISKVPLLIDQEGRVSNIFSNLTGGVPAVSVPTASGEYLWQYATLIVFISDRPRWFSDAADSDRGFVAGVYKEVMAHCAKFRGEDGDDEEGESDTEKSRVVVTSALSRARANGTKG